MMKYFALRITETNVDYAAAEKLYKKMKNFGIPPTTEFYEKFNNIVKAHFKLSLAEVIPKLIEIIGIEDTLVSLVLTRRVEDAKKLFLDLEENGKTSGNQYTKFMSALLRINTKEATEDLLLNTRYTTTKVYGELLTMYSKLVLEDKGKEEFLQLMEFVAQKGIQVVSTALLPVMEAYSKIQDVEKAEEYFNKAKIELKRVIPMHSYLQLLNCYANQRLVTKAEKLFDEFIVLYPTEQLRGYSILVKLYANTLNVEKAEKLYSSDHVYSESPLLVYQMFRLYTFVQDISKAELFFRKLLVLSRNPDDQSIFYSKLIQLYLNKGLKDKAFGLLDEMQASLITPDFSAYSMLMHEVTNKKTKGWEERKQDFSDRSQPEPEPLTEASVEARQEELKQASAPEVSASPKKSAKTEWWW